MDKTALLVVDVQTALVEGHPYDEANVIRNIENMISLCRGKGIEVIYIRHDGGTGDELEYNSRGWSIYKQIAPTKNEKIFDKNFNSAFRQTGLRDYLDGAGIKTLIITGMQTEYCIDATCKAAFEYGYNVIIPESTTTTYDNEFLTGKELCEFYTRKIWNNRFARVISTDQLKELQC